MSDWRRAVAAYRVARAQAEPLYSPAPFSFVCAEPGAAGRKSPRTLEGRGARLRLRFHPANPDARVC